MRAGQVVGDRYRLEERLGSGSHGEVWKAADVRLNDRPVAVKRALVGGDPVAAARIRREAETLARVSHPNVVTIYDTVEEDGDWWIAMEYVTGPTLADIGTISTEEAARYGAQLAGALESVHATGILHRDIKPSNVIVTEQGYAKLADFGIARSLHAEPTLTGTGTVTGTPGYVAPEVVRGGKFTAAADVFSLGATLFYAVEGTSPFGDDNAHALLWKTAQGERIATKRAGDLAPLLDQLLQTEPKQRPRPGQARQALGKLCGEPTIGYAGPPRRDRKLVWTVAAAVALVVLAGAAWTAFRPSEGTIGDVSNADAPPADSNGDLVGEEATADPCSLIDTEALARFGEPTLDTDAGPFTRCDVNIEFEDADVEVQVFFYTTTGGPGSGGESELVGDISVVRYEGTHEECERTLVLPDGETMISVDAEQERTGEADPCEIADVAVDGALARLEAGQIPRREGEPDPASLSNLDACELLDDEALENFPGVDADHPIDGFGGWDCQWHSTTSGNDLRIFFERIQPLTTNEGEPLTLAGREAYFQGDRWGEDKCLVSIVHRERPSTQDDGTMTAEVIRLVVDGDAPAEELCGQALAVAEPAAAALPET